MKLRLGNGERDRERYQIVAMTLGQWFPRMRAELAKLGEAPRGVELELRAIPKQQTDSQRGYYHMSLGLWAEELGYSAREAHDQLHTAVLCETFGVLKSMNIGGRIVEIPNRRSSRLDRDGYSMLIETMIRMAAETGVAIPPPSRSAA